MKKAFLALLAFILISQTVFAYDLNACIPSNVSSATPDFNGIGCVIMQGAFSATPLFFALVFFAIFALTMYVARVPAGASIAIGVITVFALGPFFGVYYGMLFNLFLIVIGGLVGLAILHFVRY